MLHIKAKAPKLMLFSLNPNHSPQSLCGAVNPPMLLLKDPPPQPLLKHLFPVNAGRDTADLDRSEGSASKHSAQTDLHLAWGRSNHSDPCQDD